MTAVRHGSYAGYQAGCRQPCCRAANAAYHRAHRPRCPRCRKARLAQGKRYRLRVLRRQTASAS